MPTSGASPTSGRPFRSAALINRHPIGALTQFWCSLTQQLYPRGATEWSRRLSSMRPGNGRLCSLGGHQCVFCSRSTGRSLCFSHAPAGSSVAPDTPVASPTPATGSGVRRTALAKPPPHRRIQQARADQHEQRDDAHLSRGERHAGCDHPAPGAHPEGYRGEDRHQAPESVHFETGELHHLAPLLGFFDDELCEIGG
jgi:hypothetical protein